MTAQLITSPHSRQAKVVRNLSWTQLEELDRSLEDIAGLKLIYLDGTLEIMPVDPAHEDFKSTIALLIEVYLRFARIRFYKRGSPTLGDPALGARNEPDESYTLDTQKPSPDLVIEVVNTSGGIDRLEGYRRLGVREVMYWEDGVLDFYQLQPQGYVKSKGSALLPDLPIDLLRRYIVYHDQYDAVIEFEQALRGN